MVEIFMPLATLMFCIFRAGDAIIAGTFKCDPDNRMAELLSGALAAALAFAAGFMRGRVPEPPKPKDDDHG
jgi:hypothetical protein